jgi:FkbM family methyltransferase
MSMMRIGKWSYVDVGANDPIRGNTFFSQYLTQGASGINIEPNPIIFRRLARLRPNDRSIQMALVAGNNREVSFYINQNSKISSLSFNSEAHRVQVKTIFPREILEMIALINLPWVLKIDIEGTDIEVLKKFIEVGADPALIIIETFEGIEGSSIKIEELHRFLDNKYVMVSMTPLNNFYAKKTDWIFLR